MKVMVPKRDGVASHEIGCGSPASLPSPCTRSCSHDVDAFNWLLFFPWTHENGVLVHPPNVVSGHVVRPNKCHLFGRVNKGI
jgi:hypothetical protein